MSDTTLSSSTKAKLKECPFCGSNDTRLDFTDNYARVLCMNASCCATGPTQTIAAEAIRMWNNVTRCL